jgi:hypothetical protein
MILLLLLSYSLRRQRVVSVDARYDTDAVKNDGAGSVGGGRRLDVRHWLDFWSAMTTHL